MIGKLQYLAWYNPEGLNVVIDTSASVSIGEWTHVAVAHDGSQPRLYICGELAAGEEDISVWHAPGEPDFSLYNLDDIGHTTVGARYRGNGADQAFFWNGDLKDIRLYDRVLTQPEIAGLASE